MKALTTEYIDKSGLLCTVLFENITFSVRHYYRTYTIPWGVDCDKVKAAFRKGAIKVTLPKMEKAKIERKSVKITCD